MRQNKHILWLTTVFLIAFSISSCSLIREEEKKESNTIQKNDISLKGDVGGVPVNLKLIHSGKSQTIEESSKDTSSPAIETGSSLITNLLMILAGGGAGGFILKNMRNKMLGRMAQGIEEFSKEDPKAAEKLKTHLSRRMDSSDKEIIKKVKK